MAFQSPPTYTAPPTTSFAPSFVLNFSPRVGPPGSSPPKAATTRCTPKGRRVRVKLPPSPSPSSTQRSLDTPKQNEYADEDDDPSFVGSESERSSDDEECEELSDEDHEELTDDGDDNDKELLDKDEEESSDDDDDGIDFDDVAPVGSFLSEIRKFGSFPFTPYIPATALPGTFAAEWGEKDGKQTTQPNVAEKGETAGKRDDSPATSAPTANIEHPRFTFGKTSPMPIFGNTSSITTTSVPQPTPGRESTSNFPAAWNMNPELTLPKTPTMSLSNTLLFNEVFKIQEIDCKSHPCRGLDAQGAQCKSSVPRWNSLSIKLLENSLETSNGIRTSEIKTLALYNMCDAHTKQSMELAEEWIRLASLTRPARKYWLGQQKLLFMDWDAFREEYTEFAATEIRRILAQDEVAVRAEKEKTKLYNESQKTITQLQAKIDNIGSEIFLTEELNNKLKAENSSLKEARDSTKDALAKERERNERNLSDAKDLYKESQQTIEALRNEVDTLNSCISELITKEPLFKNSLGLTLDAEKVRNQELEIRLKERIALGSKIQDLSETKLEKYLHKELDKSQRHILQQQKDFEKLRDDQVRLQIANATLESQVKQIEAVKEELSRASKKEFQELAARNPVCSRSSFVIGTVMLGQIFNASNRFSKTSSRSNVGSGFKPIATALATSSPECDCSGTTATVRA